MMTDYLQVTYVAAENDYRLARARSQYTRPSRPHRVPRRPSLQLPRLRRRPVAVA